MIPKIVYCPNCKKRINVPRFLLSGNIQVKDGITIECGDKKCGGKVNIKTELKTQEV